MNADMASTKYDNDIRQLKAMLTYTASTNLERFSYDLEMETPEQNRNNKRTKIERFDSVSSYGWFFTSPFISFIILISVAYIKKTKLKNW